MAADRRLGRLAREDDFRRVYRNGIRRSNTLVVIHALPNTSGVVRLGMAVSRRLGGAVTRNRVRRRLREAVRAQRASLRKGVDLVLTPRDTVPGAAYSDVCAAVEDALAAAGMLAAGARGRRT